MDQSTRDRRRSPPKVQMGLRALLLITCILNFVLSASGSNCGNIITPKHLAFMEDLIGNQLQTPCNVTFNFVDLPNMHTDDQQKACYVLRAIPWVGRILKRQTESYTLSSTNFNHSTELKKLYDSLLSEQCLRRDERSTIDAKRCSRTYSMSPRDMLMIVKDVFIITKELLDKKPVECADPYDTCEDLDDEEEPEAITTTGPAQCTCSCPSPAPTGSLLMPEKPGSPQEHSRDPTGPDKPPIPEDEESIGRAHVYLVVPCIVGLLLALSGLFYYRHQNQILRRELQRTTFRTEHQEERPLNTPDSFQLEMVE